MIEAIFEWAWRCGLDVSLRSNNFRFPIMSPPDNCFRLRQPLDFVDHAVAEGDIPVIRFSRGDRHIEIQARNWADLVKRLEYEQRRVFSELTCPPLRLPKLEEKKA